MTIAICVSLLTLPTGSEWRMLIKVSEAGKVNVQETFKGNNQSTLLLTAQNDTGVTIDAVEVPVAQFIGGGVTRLLYLDGTEQSYSVIYISGNSVDIQKSDGVKQVRIWAK